MSRWLATWCSLAFTLIAQIASAGSGWILYDRFDSLWAKNDPISLHVFASQLDASRDIRDQSLGLLVKGAAYFRAGDIPAAARYLDSLFAFVPAREGLLHSTGHRINSLIMTQLGDGDRGVAEANVGLSLLHPGQFEIERTMLLLVRAEAYIRVQRYEEALSDVREAERLTARTKDRRSHCYAQHTQATILFKQHRFAAARAGFLAAFNGASANGFDKLAQSALSNLGNTLTMEGDLAEAKAIYDSLLTGTGKNDPMLAARLNDQLGFVHSRMDDHENALTYYRRARQLVDSVNDVIMFIRVEQHMAGSLWSLGDRSRAIRSLEHAIAKADGVSRPDLSAQMHWSLTQWYRSSGDHAAALFHLQHYAGLSDSLSAAEYDKNLAQSEVLFETERKERRISEQDQALELSAAETRRKSIQRNALIASTVLLAVIAVLLIRTIRTRRRLAQKDKELHNEHVDQLLSQQEIKSINAMLEGQEKERDRMAKDLHDRLGSMLGGIKANVAVLEDRVEQMSHDKQYVKVNKLLDQAVGELRQISHDMAAATLSRFGLEKALKDLSDTIHINGRLSVELKTFGLDHRLDRSIELAVYRMVQELVSNVLKHAQARELSIAVTRSPGRLSVVVADDGRGFDTDAAADGMGLANVRSRASALGATVQVDSTPGKGTTVSVECPVVE